MSITRFKKKSTNTCLSETRSPSFTETLAVLTHIQRCVRSYSTSEPRLIQQIGTLMANERGLFAIKKCWTAASTAFWRFIITWTIVGVLRIWCAVLRNLD